MTYNTVGDVIVGVGSVEQPEFTAGGLTVEPGIYRYKLVDGAVVERTQEELAADVLPQPAPTQAEINAANIDYLAMMTGVEL